MLESLVTMKQMEAKNLGWDEDVKENNQSSQAAFSPMALRIKIASYAKELGFDLCGFSPAKIEEKYLAVFDQWLEEGLNADMSYMEKIEQRRDMQTILPGAQSVVVLAVNYNREQAPLLSGSGRVARYAYGRDYHKVMGGMLKKLEKFICGFGDQSELAPVRCKSYVDTGPVMERALAEQAGLGQIGKNGCLITKEFGSWVFLSEVITTLDLNLPEPESVRVHTLSHKSLPGQTFTSELPAKSFPGKTFCSDRVGISSQDSSDYPPRGGQSSIKNLAARQEKTPHVCGNCTKCITACPTGAIIRPGVVDARLCISYLTIENRDKIPPHLAEKIKETKRIFGCDICQEVCPHNAAKEKPTAHPELSQNPIAGDQLSANKISQINTAPDPDKKFLQTFAGSPIMRAKRSGITRNLEAIE